MKEIFKPIPGWPDYQVSNLGNVKSLPRKVKHRASLRSVKERILKGHLIKGYIKVHFFKKGIRKGFAVHQLVAMAFLGHKPDGFKLVINHKDFNKLNNNINNLEIVTHRENSNQKHLKSTSKYTGVSWSKDRKKWISRIRVKDKYITLGRYKNEARASIAYDLALFQIDRLNKLVNN